MRPIRIYCTTASPRHRFGHASWWGRRCTLQALLDLTDASIRRRIGFTLAELLDEDWQTIQDEGDEPGRDDRVAVRTSPDLKDY